MPTPADPHAPRTWFLLPARGGSKGVPRKVLRDLGGKPLIRHVLDTLSAHVPREQIVVSTDSAEIAAACEAFAVIHPRAPEHAGDQATLDQVAASVGQWLRERGAQDNDLFATIQPTSPLISFASIERGLQMLRDGSKSVLTVRRDPHLRWSLDEQGQPAPLYKARVNRQWATPCFVETGGVIAARLGDVLASGTRIHAPTALLELDEREGLDIDTHADWATAEYFARRQRILIRGDASPLMGMGHVHRMLALAYELASHDVTLVTRSDGPNALGADFLAQAPFALEKLSDEEAFFRLVDTKQPDLVILDVLDTQPLYVERVRSTGAFVVNLEDVGPGARVADLVINDLYTDLQQLPRHWYSVQYSVVNPAFELVTPRPVPSPSVERVLISFGGTDPNDLTRKALSALKMGAFAGEVTVVLGPGYGHGSFELGTYGLRGSIQRSVQNMAALMREADLAITAAGRTVTELMMMGVPMIAMCQNTKELRHTHASSPFGVLNLGLGQHVDVSTLAHHVQMLMDDHTLRADMRARALLAVRERGNAKVAHGILQAAATARADRGEKS
jgi:spore coat polysaccharide biosynthesis predicted glycosyltransferase SpsG